MIRVGLVTNWQEACAVAEYANSLVTHVDDPEVEFKIITRPLTFERIMNEARDVDVLHFNVAWWLFDGITGDQWRAFRKRGKRVLITLHESYEPEIRSLGGLGPAADAIVVHEEPSDGLAWPEGFYYIPQGIRLVEGLPKWNRLDREAYKLGTLGFPFWWKNYRLTAKVARKLGLGFMFLMGKPKSDKVDLDAITQEILEIHPEAEIVTGWQPYDYMVRRLSECVATVFPYNEAAKIYGVSAGVRMGMAAQRPIIVSKHAQQFKDLKKYPDEVYVTHSSKLEEAISLVLQDTKDRCERKPAELLKVMSWRACATKYVQIYKELANMRVVPVVEDYAKQEQEEVEHLRRKFEVEKMGRMEKEYKF